MMRRKYTFKANGKQIVLIQQSNENAEHVLMKALIWALYLPSYPAARVEVAIGDRYKPDVIALDTTGIPQFWGEAGQVGEAKWRALLRRYPHTHFAWGKWATRLTPHVALVEHALAGLAQRAAVDILEFPHNSATRFVDDSGQITVDFADVNWVRLTQRDAGANRRVPS